TRNFSALSLNAPWNCVTIKLQKPRCQFLGGACELLDVMEEVAAPARVGAGADPLGCMESRSAICASLSQIAEKIAGELFCVARIRYAITRSAGFAPPVDGGATAAGADVAGNGVSRL